MATNHHTTLPWSAAASLLFAFAIGFAPIVALLAMAETLEALQ